jgi:hypothetical protein
MGGIMGERDRGGRREGKRINKWVICHIPSAFLFLDWQERKHISSNIQLLCLGSAQGPQGPHRGYLLFRKVNASIAVLSAFAATVQLELQTDITLWHSVVISIASVTSCTHFVLQRICQISELFRPSYWQLRVEFHIVNHQFTVQHSRNCNSTLHLTSLLAIPSSTSHCIG